MPNSCAGNGLTVSGSQVFLSPTIPATLDQTGFRGIADWGEITKFSNIGTIGDTWQTATFTLIDEARENHVKTFRAAEALELTYLFGQETSTGLTYLEDAFNSYCNYSFKIIFPNGKIVYFLGLVLGEVIDAGDGSAVLMYNSSIQPNSNFVKDEIATGTQHTLTYIAGANGEIVGSAIQIVANGTDGSTVVAVPLDPLTHEFDSWSDSVSTATRRDTNVTADITVTATFKTL